MTLMIRGISALIGESKGHVVWLSEWTELFVKAGRHGSIILISF